jgi:hypothetical protein
MGWLAQPIRVTVYYYSFTHIEQTIEVPARRRPVPQHPAALPPPPPCCSAVAACREGALLRCRHLGRLLLIVQIVTQSRLIGWSAPWLHQLTWNPCYAQMNVYRYKTVTMVFWDYLHSWLFLLLVSQLYAELSHLLHDVICTVLLVNLILFIFVQHYAEVVHR